VPESTTKDQLDLQVGDYTIWQDKQISIKNDSNKQIDFVSSGMIGKVITASDNPLAQQLKHAGLPIDAGPWALVEFENGAKLMVRDGMDFQKVREQ